MDNDEEELPDLPYDFICLCCGGINGEVIPECTANRYVYETEPSSEDALFSMLLHPDIDVLAWFASHDYRGAILVPVGYNLTAAYRQAIADVTKYHTMLEVPGIVLYKLPMVDEDLEEIVDISTFYN